MDEGLSATFNDVLNRASSGDRVAIDQLIAMGPEGEESQIATAIAQHLLEAPENISDDLRATLIARIAPRGADALDEERAEVVYQLIAGVDLEKHLSAIDRTLKSYLYPQLATSDHFNDALKKWDAWAVEDKIAYGKKFAQAFSRIASTHFATPQADVVAANILPQDGMTAAFGDCMENARTGQCTVRMNTHDNVAFKSHKDFDETLYHELMHTVQKGLAFCARTGQMNRLPREFRTSAILLGVMNTRMFYSKIMKDPQAYAAFPMEAHAENNARDFGKMMHDWVSRENLVARHKMHLVHTGFGKFGL